MNSFLIRAHPRNTRFHPAGIFRKISMGGTVFTARANPHGGAVGVPWNTWGFEYSS
ncbi:MAG: hypothetical protein ABSH08_20035 [Tepidisphaeraceae bacterium]|jgi:hypothetical protein